MFVLCLMVLWQLPWEWAFSPRRAFLYIMPTLIIDLFFLADIFVILQTGIPQCGVIELDKASIET
jgi:hypothetical protein